MRCFNQTVWQPAKNTRREKRNDERSLKIRDAKNRWQLHLTQKIPLAAEAISKSKIFYNSFNKIYRTFIFCIMDIYYTIVNEYSLNLSIYIFHGYHRMAYYTVVNKYSLKLSIYIFHGYHRMAAYIAVNY